MTNSSETRTTEKTPKGLEVAVAQCTSAGNKACNEDAIGIRIPNGSALNQKGIVAVIADGVSTAEGGREASETAVTSFLSDYYSTHDAWSVKTSAIKVLNALNIWLYGLSKQAINTNRGHITTCSALILKSASAHIFHVGDSRIYRLRSGALEQLTRDHAVTAGKNSRYLARALGFDPKLEVDYRQLEIQPDDLFVLTTDGIHDFLATGELKQKLLDQNGQPTDHCCEQLIELAMSAGSEDNLSVQMLKVLSTGDPESSERLLQAEALPFPPPIKEGLVIDGWKVIRELHATARSEVYLVERPADASEGESKVLRAAMKVPSAYYEDDQEYIERFLLEEWIGSRIQSPHVVKVLRTPQEQRFLYYLTEYIEGPTLAQLMKERTRLSIVDARNIITQVTSGLRAFHRKESLHQDIKPENIIYTEQGVKIIDFGSTRVASMREQSDGREPIMGTLDYVAPEYHLKQKVSPASDQFSLAVLFYKMVTAKHPYGKAYSKAKTKADFAQLEYRPASKYNPLVPDWIDASLERAVNIEATDRYPALSELIQDLKKPNPSYVKRKQKQKTASSPLRLWQSIALVSIAINLLLLVLLSKN